MSNETAVAIEPAEAAPEQPPPDAPIALVHPEGSQLCDREDGKCREPAVFSYTWDWGESGVCCAKHQVVLSQLQRTLKRNCVFVPLNPGASPPLQREERVRLKAEALTLAEELEEMRSRGLELYRQNTGLTKSLQAMTVRHREADAQLRDAIGDLEAEKTRADRLAAENAELADEVSRLRTLVEAEDPQLVVTTLNEERAKLLEERSQLQAIVDRQAEDLRDARETSRRATDEAERARLRESAAKAEAAAARAREAAEEPPEGTLPGTE